MTHWNDLAPTLIPVWVPAQCEWSVWLRLLTVHCVWASELRVCCSLAVKQLKHRESELAVEAAPPPRAWRHHSSSSSCCFSSSQAPVTRSHAPPRTLWRFYFSQRSEAPFRRLVPSVCGGGVQVQDSQVDHVMPAVAACGRRCLFCSSSRYSGSRSGLRMMSSLLRTAVWTVYDR